MIKGASPAHPFSVPWRKWCISFPSLSFFLCMGFERTFSLQVVYFWPSHFLSYGYSTRYNKQCLFPPFLPLSEYEFWIFKIIGKFVDRTPSRFFSSFFFFFFWSGTFSHYDVRVICSWRPPSFLSLLIRNIKKLCYSVFETGSPPSSLPFFQHEKENMPIKMVFFFPFFDAIVIRKEG